MQRKQLLFLMFFTSNSVFAADTSVVNRTLLSGEPVPAHVYAQQSVATERLPTVDNSTNTAYLNEYSQGIENAYAPVKDFYLELPNDIALSEIKTVTVGYKTVDQLNGMPDKLSIYMSQYKAANHFWGLYKQRIIGWSGGIAPKGMNVERAIYEEQKFNFLGLVISPETLTPEQLEYLQQRLSLQHFVVIKHWVDTAPQGVAMELGNIIAAGLANQKIQLGY